MKRNRTWKALCLLLAVITVIGIFPLSGLAEGDTGGSNPGSPGGAKPGRGDIAWTTDPERTFLRFTLIEFPKGVVQDLNTNDTGIWKTVGTLNVVWDEKTVLNLSGDEIRRRINWYDSNAMQFNAQGNNAAQLMGTTVVSYDASQGVNQRKVMSASEFADAAGLTHEQKEQMFHLNSASWSSGWLYGDYTSMWGDDPHPVTDGNEYNVYTANKAFIYLLSRLSETNGEGSGWSEDEAISKWTEKTYDDDGNLRTKYRVIVETGAVLTDPDRVSRAYTLREMMAYSLYNNEKGNQYDLLWDQSPTIVNAAQWMRQSVDNQFVEYPLDESGVPTGEELHSTNGFRECDSFVKSVSSGKVRNTIFAERRSFGLHILSPFNFESDAPSRPTLEVTKVSKDPVSIDTPWDFTVTYTAGKPTGFTATKNGEDFTDEITDNGTGLKFSLKGGETVHVNFEADGELRYTVKEDDTSELTAITGTGGTANLASGKFTSTGSTARVTFTNGKGTVEGDVEPEPEPGTLGLKIVKYDRLTHTPMAGVTFEIFHDALSLGRYETDSNGEIVLEEVEPGTYAAVEVDTGDGSHILDGTYQQIELAAGDGVRELIFFNDSKPGLCLVKVDSETMTPLAGAKFRVEAVDGSFGPNEYTTDASGEIDLSDLPEGSYVVTEITAPDGYLIDDAQRIIHLHANDTAEFVFTDTKRPKLVVEKRSAKDGTPLAGATFRIAPIDDPDSFANKVTDDQGRITMEGLDAGVYSVLEVSAPEGYVLNATEYHVKLKPGETSTIVFENEKRPALRIVKYDAQTKAPLKDTTFEIYRDTELIGTYTTDENGEILLYDLDPGTYLVKEVSAPDSHVLNSTPQEIELEAGKTGTLVFLNYLKPGIYLVKLDSQTMEPLANARFRITQVGGDFSQEYITDANGEIDLSGLNPGTYTVEELAAPDGYLIDDAQRIIKIEGGEKAQFVFTDTKKPSFKLIKLDELTGQRLHNATFRIAKIQDGTHYLDRVTDMSGEIVIYDLEPGVYSVKEMAAPNGYVRNPIEYHVELVPGRQAVLVVSDAQRPKLTVYKHDADTGEPVPGTVFQVKAADGHSVNEIRTDADGKASIDFLLPGVYEISEKYVPAPYLMDAESQLVTLYPNREHTVYFKNHKKPTITVNKIDSITGSPIKGAKFQAWYGSNSTTTGEVNDLGTFYTDENGQFFLDELRDGWYRITELEPAAGYTMKEPSTQEFYLKGGESKTVTFENTPKNAIIVEKYDSVTGEALAGCTFQLRYLGGTSGTGGTVIGTKVTGKNGVAMWTGLDPGTYIVEEVDPADGYNILQSSETVFLADNGEQSVVTVRFLNSPDGMLLVRKVCSVNPSVTLAGAEFKISYADGTLIGDSNGIFVTDEKGEIRVTGLKPGKSVIVTETRAPAGFIIDSQSQTVQIKEGRVVSLTFRNQPKGAIVVKKVDSATGKPLSGAEFRITTSAGCEVGLNGVIGSSTLTQNGIFTTDVSGEIRISNLAPGTYVLTELKAPDGYVMDAVSTNVVIGNGGDTQIVTVKNSKAGTFIVDKRDSRTGKPLEGVQFRITTASGEFVPDENGRISSNGIYFTDADGRITVNGVVGTLVVTEMVALPGYTMDNRPQTVVVDPNDTQTLYFTNTPSTTLVIEKYIEGTMTPLKGVTFLVTDSSGAVVGKSNGEYITDENGRIVIEDLTPGTTITAKEVKVPDDFVLDTTPKSILIKKGEVQTLRFYNRAKGTLVIQKKDSVTGTLLSGAKFLLTYADGSFVDYDNGQLSSKGIYVTDENGEIRVYGVVGTIVAKELEAAPGYVIDPKTQTQTVAVNAEDTQALVFRNEPLVSLTITKLDSVTGKPVSGAEFTVRDSYGNLLGKYVTGKDGTVTVTGLIPGTTLIVQESNVPKGYVLDPTPKVITVKNGSNSVSAGDGSIGSTGSGTGNDLVFENDPTVSLVIEKYIDGTTTPLQGVTFLVTDSGGKVIGGSNGEYITDENGRIVIRDLEPGTTVVAREVKTVDGYVLDTTPKTIEIKAGEAQTLRFYNKAAGTLVVQKKDKQTGEPLAGVEFEITYSDGSYVDADYGHLSSKGLYKTDANGEIRIPGVVGTVVVTETKPLEGYVMDEGTRSQTVVVNPGDTQTVVVYNTKMSGLTIVKEDEDTGARLKGVQFEIRKLNGEIVGHYTTDVHGTIYLPNVESGWYEVIETSAASGYKLDDTPHRVEVKDGGTALLEITNRRISGITVHKTDSATGKGIYGVVFMVYDNNKKPVEQIVTDQNGYAYTDTALEAGRYYVRELETAEGYLEDKEYKTIIVETGKNVIIEWKNTAVTGQIQITKTSADYNSNNGWAAGTPIPGTEFEIYNRAGSLVDTVRTDKNGVAKTRPLPLGRYTIIESKAASFYALDKTPIEVEIEFAGQIVRAAMTNKSLLTNVSITKRGYSEVMPGQTIRYDFSGIANNSTTSLESFYWRDTLPTGALRLSKIVTGTWSAQGNYKIVYKTNLSQEYRLLADNLSTARSYTLAASPVALGLANNEYVTEFMYVFGIVPAGFRQVEAPKVYCTVLSNLADGVQFTNVADVGGVYGGQWVMAVDRWVTTVYAPTEPTPLPRTGY